MGNGAVMSEPDDPQYKAEELDEDMLDADPLEEGMDPPDEWAAADRYGMTEAEQREGESLEQRLSEEEPDAQP